MAKAKGSRANARQSTKKRGYYDNTVPRRVENNKHRAAARRTKEKDKWKSGFVCVYDVNKAKFIVRAAIPEDEHPRKFHLAHRNAKRLNNPKINHNNHSKRTKK